MPLTFSPKVRLAGALYLLIAVAGGFGIGYMPMTLLVAGDGIATQTAIAGALGTFKAGIAAQGVVVVAEIILSVLLFIIFAPFGRLIALGAALARLVMAVMQGLNIRPLWDMMSTAGVPRVADQASLHLLNVFIWQIPFALHLALLGWLLWRLRGLAHWLGLGLFIGSFGYLGDALIGLGLTQGNVVTILSSSLLALAVISEIGFTFWLLFARSKAT